MNTMRCVKRQIALLALLFACTKTHPAPPPIAVTEYDDLFVCTPPKLLTLRYGAPAR